MLTPQQLAQFDTEGAVTIDTPFTAQQIAAASDAVDRKYAPNPGGFSGYDMFEPELLELALHPFVFECAAQALRTKAVALRASAIRKSPPQRDAKEGLEGEHVDICYRATDLAARPMNILCTVLVWISDATATRAPFMYRPRTHRLLSDHFQTATEFTFEAVTLDKLPKLDYPASVPLLAKAGQISVTTTALIHSGSHNLDTEARKVMFLQFQAKGIPEIPFNSHTRDKQEKYCAELSEKLGPMRKHLLEV